MKELDLYRRGEEVQCGSGKSARAHPIASYPADTYTHCYPQASGCPWI